MQTLATYELSLVMSRGKRFEAARQFSVLFALALRIKTERPRYTTFGEGSDLEYDDLASMHNCTRLERLTFRAQLSTNGSERFELTKA